MPAIIRTHHTGYDRYNRINLTRLGEGSYITSEYPLTANDIAKGQFQVENETDGDLSLDVKTVGNPTVWVAKKFYSHDVCDLLCVAIRPTGGSGNFQAGIVVG